MVECTCILCGKKVEENDEKVSTYDRYNTKEPYVHAACHVRFLEEIIEAFGKNGGSVS